MHRIDRLELLNTLAEARREAKLVLGELQRTQAGVRLRRIVVLLGYMAEHLEMVGGPTQLRLPQTRGLDQQN